MDRFFPLSPTSNSEFALNVWGGSQESKVRSQKSGVKSLKSLEEIGGEARRTEAGLRWRWQLLRLNDGKADEKEGEATDLPDATASELHAALEGLGDLQQRIERAGRSPKQFAVEIRCTQAAKEAAETGRPYGDLARRFAAACALWQQVGLVVVQ